jgi:hypothetical protein
METSIGSLSETNKQLGASGLVEIGDSAVGSHELSEHRERLPSKAFTLKYRHADHAHPLANRKRLPAPI